MKYKNKIKKKYVNMFIITFIELKIFKKCQKKI